MDEEIRATQSPARWLGWVTAGLLVSGLVSVGTVSDRNQAAEQRIVTAAGTGADGVDLPTTAVPTTLPPLPTLPPTTALATTTTVARSTTVPPTTQAPRTTTTTSPVRATTTTVPTTVTTVAAGTMLKVVNEHPFAVILTVNGRVFQLAPGEQAGPVQITRYDHGNDIVEAKLVQEPTCGMGDADGYFATPGSYRMAVVASPGLCQPGMPGPNVKVTRL